jgi:hypothetical protein
VLHGLLGPRDSDPERLDLQLRREQRGKRSWVSLYKGITSVLDVDESKGRFRLRAHPTHRKVGQFDPDWTGWRTPAELGGLWPAVEGYLDRILVDGMVDERWVRSEGLVHAAIASGSSEAYAVIQREASVSFAWIHFSWQRASLCVTASSVPSGLLDVPSRGGRLCVTRGPIRGSTRKSTSCRG